MKCADIIPCVDLGSEMSGMRRNSLEYCRQMMVDFRRDMHRHPEPGFEETRTAAKIAAILQSLGIEVHEGLGGTGVVGVLRNGTAYPHSQPLHTSDYDFNDDGLTYGAAFWARLVSERLPEKDQEHV